MKKLGFLLCLLAALLCLAGASADETKVTIRSIDYIVDGAAPTNHEVRDNGTTYYQYNYKYGDSIYTLMTRHVEEMVASGYFVQVGYQTYGEASFWQLQYVGGGELEPIASVDGKDYHVELGCASYGWLVTFMSATLGKGIEFGKDYSAPEPEWITSSDAAITVRDFASFLSGTTLGKREQRSDGGSYYQYNYKYGDSGYTIVGMYADDLQASGLFKLVDTQRYGTIMFWELQYVGPGAEDLKPLGESSGKPYHVEVGFANLTFILTAVGNPNDATYASISMCEGIALGDITYADGYELPSPAELQAASGFSVKTRTVTRTCYVCHGSGLCNLCKGTGTYRLYGTATPCDTVCSFCKGAKTYEALETYYEHH